MEVRRRITFGEYAEAWLESRADLKPKTRHQYEWLMRQQIMPTWRTVPLAKITFADLTQWVSRLSLSSGLGPSGIRQCVFVMSAALDHAVRSGRTRSNPARGLGLPRPKRRDYVYLNHAQVLALASEAGRGRLLVLVLAYTGLRRGKATALRVCDIDFDRRRADVRRAFSDVGGRVILGTPKSHQSRTIPLPRFLAAELDLYGHLYPGEMDRYADRLNEAAGMSDPADDAAKKRPDDDLDEDEEDGEEED